MHDLIADIGAQPATILSNRPALRAAFAEIGPRLARSAQVVVTGMATSLWAWHSAGLLLQGLPLAPFIVDTSEYLRFGEPVDDGRALLVTSRSGESAELVQLLDLIKPGREVIGMTLDADSTLSRKATARLLFEAHEAAFCNTSSFTVSLCLTLALAGGWSGRRDLDPDNWSERLAGHVAGLIAKGFGSFETVAESLANARTALVCGRGHLIGVANQACLDLQEGMRIAALPVPGGLLRHGPMELVTLPDCAVIMLIPNDHVAAMAVRAVTDLVAYGARVAVIAAEGVSLPPGVPSVQLPSVEPELSPILFAVALQFMNVALAQALGMPEIRPSLIPKVTTVE